MRVLFQGAGAIGIAAAALFTDRHEVAVVSRHPGNRVAYPLRLSTLSARFDSPWRPRQANTPPKLPSASAVRRVAITDWESAHEFDWDLLVLTTRPCDLDAEVAESIRALSPRAIAITSQVAGDLDDARALAPRAEAVVFAPSFLAERTSGTHVRYWLPPAMRPFMMTGNGGSVLQRELGPLVRSVPAALVFDLPAVFISFAAELSVHGGDWQSLKSHLVRPSRAATEAIASVSGAHVPVVPAVARGVLEVLERVSPIELDEYAGRHFGRHLGQTVDMLAEWERPGGTSSLTDLKKSLWAVASWRR